MKASGKFCVFLAIAMLLFGCAAPNTTTVNNNQSISVTQTDSSIDRDNSVDVDNNTDDDRQRVSTIEIDRSDLTQPHILRVQGSPRLERVQVKVNGKIVKSIAADTLEIDLAPLMTLGRYNIDISGTLSQSSDTVSITLTGKSANFTHQSSGNRTISQKLVINVR